MSGLLGDGWSAYSEQVIPEGAPEVQQVESRRAFYAGAVTVFYGIVSSLDTGTEPTEADLAFMENIARELAEYEVELAKLAGAVS